MKSPKSKKGIVSGRTFQVLGHRKRREEIIQPIEGGEKS